MALILGILILGIMDPPAEEITRSAST